MRPDEVAFVRLCVAALVTDPLGRVLLVRNACGWGLPGGKVKSGETWEEAAKREVLEETGVSLARVCLHDLIHGGQADGLTCDTLVIVARCKAGAWEPRAGSDALEARWFAHVELPALAKLPTIRTVSEWAGAW